MDQSGFEPELFPMPWERFTRLDYWPLAYSKTLRL